MPLESEIEPEDPMISIDSVTSAPDRWRSRSGSPARRLTTTPVSEFALICDQMSAGCAEGFVSRRRAATPATCGAAIEVPDLTVWSESEPIPAEVIPSPGAKMSTQDPWAEEVIARSERVVPATVMASPTREGL